MGAPRQWRDSVPAAKMPPKGKRGRPKKGEEKKQRKKKDPNAPKRPMSAYFLFMNATRPTVRKENPDASIGEVAKILGKMWGEIDPFRTIFNKRVKQRLLGNELAKKLTLVGIPAPLTDREAGILSSLISSH